MKRFNNYHKHTHVSGIYTPDTHIKTKDYINRILELDGAGANYFTTEHGSMGDIFESKTLCNKANLHCKAGIEGYIVPDPLEKDNANYHIVLIPRTNAARRQLNLASSNANEFGYYYKPRLFLKDLLEINKDDLYITTACVGGILRDGRAFEQIFLPLWKHFQENMFLEVQPHNDTSQIQLNSKILRLALDTRCKLIAANDSHYIYEDQAKDRLNFLAGKHINYGEEDSFILDYPDYDTLFKRFQNQGVLADWQIQAALENTLIFDDCEDIDVEAETVKMPTIYPELNDEERNQKLRELVYVNFDKLMEEEGYTGEELEKRKQAVETELQVIEETTPVHTADYFLLNEKLVKIATEKYGGILTRTGRGSCGSFYLNKVLGITQIDRMTVDLPLYSERFMSTARCLSNKAMPDIDYNTEHSAPFVQAARDLLGQDGCYVMCAYGTMQEGEAFRNECRSRGMAFDDFNEVAKDLDSYREDPYWGAIITESQKYVDTIVSISPHPCAHLISNKNIREEYGIVRVGDQLCVMLTSGEADEYHMLKDDFLVVKVWKLIHETFDMVGKPIMTIKQLMDNIDDRVWNLYRDGITCTLNQTDGDWATSLVKEYRPNTIEELSKFCGALRPSFESWRDGFIQRQSYSTGSEHLDKLLESTDGMILFQECLMQYFEWLGISPSKSIDLIKKISKKHITQEDFDNLTVTLRENWIKETGSIDMFEETWALMQSCISYGFNAPHGLAVAIDSLYGAYLKVNHPCEYYTVALNNYMGDEERTNKLTAELEYFGLKLKEIEYGHSRGGYTCDKNKKIIYKGIGSVKFLNVKDADKIYELSDNLYIDFVDFLKDKPASNRTIEILISLDFFKPFGKSDKLMKTFELFNRLYGKKQLKKDSVADLNQTLLAKYCVKETEKMYKYEDTTELISELAQEIPDKDLSLKARLAAQIEYLGYLTYANPKLQSYYYVTEINTRYAPVITAYNLANGTTETFKMYTKQFAESPILNRSIIQITGTQQKPRMRKAGEDPATGKPIWETVPNEYNTYITSFKLK